MQRRQFLKLSSSGVLAMGMMPLMPRQVFAEQPFADYKCLVNIFLFGGNDSFNLVVPSSDAEYQIYAASRQNLAVAQDSLLAINPDNPDGASYGFHPMAGGLQNLFTQGEAAIVANVGPLIEPVTRTGFLERTAELPPQLFSHNDQQDQWFTLKGRMMLNSGWAGRIADTLTTATSNQRLALNTSTFGTSLFQAGSTSIPYTVGPRGASAYGALDADDERRSGFDNYLASGFDNIHARALSRVHQRSLATADLVNNALETLPALQTSFPNSFLGQQLNIVARLIAVKDQFEMSRQIFFVGTGGFDTHDSQNQVQPNLISNLSASIQAFSDAMIEVGLNNQVVTFTQSDFGRTLTSNGDGTDHGWGGHQLVIGGPVMGRNIYGTMPVLEIDGDDDSGDGRIIPTLSADQYAATLARWFGIDEANLTAIAPSLAKFSSNNIGFL